MNSSEYPDGKTRGDKAKGYYPGSEGSGFRREAVTGVRSAFHMTANFDELVKSHPNRWLCKEAKFKARALTTTRRAGGLDFRSAAEKTKARQCLQRYACESKQARGVRRIRRRRTAATIRRKRKIGLFTKPSIFHVCRKAAVRVCHPSCGRWPKMSLPKCPPSVASGPAFSSITW